MNGEKKRIDLELRQLHVSARQMTNFGRVLYTEFSRREESWTSLADADDGEVFWGEGLFAHV